MWGRERENFVWPWRKTGRCTTAVSKRFPLQQGPKLRPINCPMSSVNATVGTLEQATTDNIDVISSMLAELMKQLSRGGKCTKLLMSDRMSEDMSGRMSERVSDRMPGDMSERMSERVSEEMSDRMSEAMSERMSESMSERMSEDMSESMSEDMPEDMSDSI